MLELKLALYGILGVFVLLFVLMVCAPLLYAYVWVAVGVSRVGAFLKGVKYSRVA